MFLCQSSHLSPNSNERELFVNFNIAASYYTITSSKLDVINCVKRFKCPMHEKEKLQRCCGLWKVCLQFFSWTILHEVINAVMCLAEHFKILLSGHRLTVINGINPNNLLKGNYTMAIDSLGNIGKMWWWNHWAEKVQKKIVFLLPVADVQGWYQWSEEFYSSFLTLEIVAIMQPD